MSDRSVATAVFSLFVAFFSPDGVAAQDVTDWDIHREARGRAVMAYAQYDTGLGIGFRCIDGAFGAVISGLPPARAERRNLMIRFDADQAHSTGWTATTDRTVAVADLPAPLARQFRKGGPLRITVPREASNGADVVFEVDLPPSNQSIDQVLTECGRPVVDPRDAILEAVSEDGGPGGGVVWARAPRPTFPHTQYAAGFVVTTCLTTPDGRLSDCLNEMEHPPASRFGDAVLRASRDARVVSRQGVDSPIPVRRIAFRTLFATR